MTSVYFSAGVGRTGTFIGLDALMKHGKYSASVDVYEYTLKMRKDRMNMIQTLVSIIINGQHLGFLYDSWVVSSGGVYF